VPLRGMSPALDAGASQTDLQRSRGLRFSKGRARGGRRGALSRRRLQPWRKWRSGLGCAGRPCISCASGGSSCACACRTRSGCRSRRSRSTFASSPTDRLSAAENRPARAYRLGGNGECSGRARSSGANRVSAGSNHLRATSPDSVDVLLHCRPGYFNRTVRPPPGAWNGNRRSVSLAYARLPAGARTA
jgi:hypothetical protein